MIKEMWKTQRLGDLCTKIGSGATPRGGKETYLDKGPFAFVRSQNVLDFFCSTGGLAFISQEQANLLSNVELKERDVLLNITGDSVARVCQIPSSLLPGRVNQHVSIIRPDESKLIPEFLKYYLLNPSFKNYMLGLASVGGTRNALTKGMIEEFEIEVPPPAIQRRIAAILSALDEKIELNRQTNATLETIAQAIFKEWFVDFRFPGATAEMQDTELGPIPKVWEVGKLGDFCDRITKGTTPTTFGDKFIGEGVRFLRAECIQDDVGIDESKALFISIETHGKLKRSQLSQNDILITIAGAIGRTGIVTERILPANINQAVAIIRTDPSLLTPIYVFYHLRRQTTRDELLSGITQSVQANISLTDLSNLRLTIPSRSLLDQFDKVVEGIRKHIENLTEQLGILIKTRDSLLPRLMNGEIEI